MEIFLVLDSDKDNLIDSKTVDISNISLDILELIKPILLELEQS